MQKLNILFIENFLISQQTINSVFGLIGFYLHMFVPKVLQNRRHFTLLHLGGIIRFRSYPLKDLIFEFQYDEMFNFDFYDELNF
jgi:hypothetical protein